ncbi:MAG TPA: aldo/keto reductase [Nocardioides sp.]|nr:aldo/keto reductase [Nocardioides sp.]
MSVPNVVLNNGIEIPQLGFGVWRVPSEETQKVVELALGAGYRHIDTAKLYGNERGVGAAVRASGLDRDEVFVTSKVWNDDQGYDDTLRAFDTTMDELGFDVLDLYLIHWPVPSKGLAAETWRAMEKLYHDGRIRAIGVSNFHAHHLEALMRTAEVRPTVNQVELHPYHQQRAVRDANDRLEIATEAWSPLAKGRALLDDPVVGEVASRHDRTPAQVVLRWHLQHGTIVIPKSVTPSRIEENIDVFDFELGPDEILAINGIDRDERIGDHPDEM